MGKFCNKTHVRMTTDYRLKCLILLLFLGLCLGCSKIHVDLEYHGVNTKGDMVWWVSSCRGRDCDLLMDGDEYIFYVESYDKSVVIPDSELVWGSKWHLTGVVELDTGLQENGMYQALVWFLKYETYEKL